MLNAYSFCVAELRTLPRQGYWRSKITMHFNGLHYCGVVGNEITNFIAKTSQKCFQWTCLADQIIMQEYLYRFHLAESAL